jgi:hypothetical protein
MSQQRVEASGEVPAPPSRVYAILSDYREHHPRILPRQFRKLEVEEGGTGAGTVFRLEMEVLGKHRSTRGTVTEPEPGRVLAEAYPENEAVTTFTLDPAPAGTRVTIATEWTPRPGLLGRLESFMTGALLRRIYAEELKLLAAYAQEQIAGAERPQSQFQPGQVWTYRTRPGEERSRVTVLNVDPDPRLGNLIHVRLDGLAIRSDLSPGGTCGEIGHLPYSEEALAASVLTLESTTQALPEFENGYRTWREQFDSGKAGVWTTPLSECVAAMEGALGRAT